MSETSPHSGLPIPGYRPQSEDNVELITHFKRLEERLLRELDVMFDSTTPHRFDNRWLALAKTHFEQGFMALNRAVFQPFRIRLPEDEKPE